MTIEMDSSSPVGNAGSPNPAASEGNVKPSSETVAVPKARWEEIERTFKRIENEDRSTKDRAVNEVKEKLGKFEEYIPALDRILGLMQEHNISKEQAIGVIKAETEDAEMKQAIREFSAFIKDGKLQTTQSPGNGGVGSGKVAEIVKEFELDENSPDIVDIYRKHGDSPEAEKAVLRLAAKKNREPSAAASTAMDGKPPQSEPDTATMIAKLNELSVNPSKHWKEIEELNKKLGWD